MTTLDRIKQLCQKRGIKVYQLEKILGYANGAISKPKEIAPSRLMAIADYFNVSLEYLVSGKNQYKEISNNEEIGEMLALISCDIELQKFINAYIKSSDKKKKLAQDIIYLDE